MRFPLPAAAALAAIFSLIGQLPGARVASAALSGCEFRSQFETIASIQKDAGLDELAKIRAELLVRKDILRALIGCLVEDASALKAKLENLPFVPSSDPALPRIKDRLVISVGQTIDFYNNELSRVDDLGIRGSQDAAREIQAWKNANYAATSKEAVGFMIWLGNQPLVKGATDRLREVASSAEKAGLLDDKIIGGLVKTASNNLDRASRANANALDNLKNGNATESSLALIQSSLELLTETYRAFFDISNAVNKTPPR